MRAKFINESVYSRKQVKEKFLDPIADELGMTLMFGGRDAKENVFGTKSTTDKFTLGDVKIITRDTKVPGMGKDHAEVWVLDKDDPTKGRRFHGMGAYIGLKDYITQQVGDTGGAPVSQEDGPIQWTKGKLDNLIADLQKDREINNFTDDQAFDMAGSILDEEEGLEAFVRRALGIKDVVGWLANQI